MSTNAWATVRDLRRAQRVSVQHIADETGNAKATVNGWLGGKRFDMSTDELLIFARIFNVEPCDVDDRFPASAIPKILATQISNAYASLGVLVDATQKGQGND